MIVEERTRFSISLRPLLGIYLLEKHLYQNGKIVGENHLMHAREWEQRELMEAFTILGKMM